jgi:hypothetical protein
LIVPQLLYSTVQRFFTIPVLLHGIKNREEEQQGNVASFANIGKISDAAADGVIGTAMKRRIHRHCRRP